LSSKVDFSVVETEVPKPKKEVKKAIPKVITQPKTPKENKNTIADRVPMAKTLKRNKNKDVVSAAESVKKTEPISNQK
jgi:hypothetical protein